MRKDPSVFCFISNNNILITYIKKKGFVNEVDSDMVLFARQKVAEVCSVLQNSGLQQF